MSCIRVIAYLNFTYEFYSSFSAAQNGQFCPDTLKYEFHLNCLECLVYITLVQAWIWISWTFLYCIFDVIYVANCHFWNRFLNLLGFRKLEIFFFEFSDDIFFKMVRLQLKQLTSTTINNLLVIVTVFFSPIGCGLLLISNINLLFFPKP